MMRVKPDRYAGLVKSNAELAIMREAGASLARVRERVAGMVKPGVSTAELDDAAREMIESMGAKPAFLGYNGFPKTLCVSINEEIVHGIPSRKRILREGDLVSIDVGLILRGFYSDTAVSVAVGKVSDEVQRLMDVTLASLDAGIHAARAGQRVGDISQAIEEVIKSNKMGIVRDYTGHGIGRELHEEPKIPNFRQRESGMRLRSGMVVAIEPMVNLGGDATEVLDDQWTVVTRDRKPSAHFEHTIAITDDGAEILTA